MLAAPAHGAVVDPDFHVVVRTYDASDALKDLAATFVDAAAILEHAGVGVTWVRCDVVFVQRDANPCLRPLAANELAIRFVRLPPHLAEQDLVTLGDSLIDTRLRVGALATIYVNRVAMLAGRCHIDVRTLLARATAHEIGHLLLGTAAHASAGLMRAAWSQAAIRRTAADDWTIHESRRRHASVKMSAPGTPGGSPPPSSASRAISLRLSVQSLFDGRCVVSSPVGAIQFARRCHSRRRRSVRTSLATDGSNGSCRSQVRRAAR